MFSQNLDFGLINNSWNGSLDLLIKSIENEDSVLCWYSETDGCHAQCRPSWTWCTDIIRNHPSYVFYIWNSMFCHHFSLHKTWFCYETYVCEMVEPEQVSQQIHMHHLRRNPHYMQALPLHLDSLHRWNKILTKYSLSVLKLVKMTSSHAAVDKNFHWMCVWFYSALFCCGYVISS